MSHGGVQGQEPPGIQLGKVAPSPGASCASQSWLPCGLLAAEQTESTPSWLTGLPPPYRLSLLRRATGDRSTSPSSAPSARPGRSSRSLPKVATPRSCRPSPPQKTQTMSSVLTAAATLLPRWLSGTFPSVRPSGTVLRPPGSTAVEQELAGTPRAWESLLLLSSKLG